MSHRSRPLAAGALAARVVLGVLVLSAVSLLGVPAALPVGAPRPRPATAMAERCPTFGGLGATSGTARVARRPAVALLRNVQVQASGCVDEVAFLFRGGLPGWSARYQPGGLVEDPSGRPVRVAGVAHLVVRLRPAAGVDLTTSRPTVVYDGPTTLRPARPSGVAALRQLGDFEATTTWVIGLAARRRYQVVRRGDQLVVRLVAPTGRVTRCTPPGTSLAVGYPAAWFAELSARWSCRYFDPRPFVILPATDAFTWAVTVSRARAGFAAVVADARSAGAAMRQWSARVAGLRAVVLDLATSGIALYPAGWRYRLYVVDAGARAVTIASTPAPPGPRASANEAAASRLAALLRRS